MSDKKYTFGQPSIMKAIEPGQKASIKFLDHPITVETEWGKKTSVTLLLLSHPLYSISSPKGIKITWQTTAKCLEVDMVGMIKEGNKEFLKDYKEMTWELSVADDGSYWLNA
jgi:hypothetical protein